MADEIDFSEFLPKTPTPVAPLPSIAPAPVDASPGGDIDFSEFMPTAPPEPGLAPAPSRPGFNIAKWLGPAGPEPVGPVQTQVTVDAPITPGQASDYQATKLWRALELERQDMRANPEPRIGSDGGPAPATSNYLDKYPVSKALGGAPSATFSQLQNTLRLDQGLEQSLPVKGLGSQFATGLGTGLQKLGTGLNFNTASIDSIDQQDAAANQDFRTPQPGWDSAAGWRDMAGSASNSLGATAPMLAGAMATRGRTLPMLARPAAMAAEASGSNFAYNALTDPRMTPLQNLSESVIEGLMTRVGGKFEPGVGTAPLGQLPLKAVGEIGEEGATSGLQSVSGQVLDPNGDGSVDWRQAGVESTIGALAGGGASVGLIGPGAIVDQVKSDAKFIGDATPKPRPYTYRFPLGRVTAEDAASFDRAKGDSRRAIEAEEAKMTPEDLAAKRASEAEFDAMQQSDMETEVPDAVEALANNAPAPNDGGTQDYLHFFGKPDNSQQETQNDLAPSRPDIVPEMAGKTTQMDVPVTQTVQARKDIVPEMSPKTQQLDVPIAQAPVKDKALSDAEAYINAMPAEDRASARDALVGWDHKADPLGYKGNIEMLKGRKELAARKAKRLADAETAKSKVVGYDAKGNIDTGVPVNPEPVAKNTVAPTAPVGPAPGPIQKPIDFEAKEGDVPHQTSESTDAPAVRKQLPRGAKKGPALVEQHLGKPGFPEKAPGNYVTRHVRLFADAGEHPMSVQAKGLGGYHIAWDPARRKAVMTAKTDTKGRKAKNGTELRSVDANGNVQTLDSGKVTLYSSVEAAVKAMAPLTKAAEPAVNVAVKGRDAIAAGVPDDTTDPENPANQTAQDTAPARKVATDAPEVGDEADQGPKKGAEVLAAEAELHGVEKELKALGARAASLTDEELDRSDALEAKVKDLKATIATKTAEASASEKAKENSPLTPKMRMDLAKALGADKVKTMTPREVGEVVRKVVEKDLGRQSTQEEVGRALRDLEANDVLTKGQAVNPGRDVEAHAVNWKPALDMVDRILGTDAKERLESHIRDFPDDQTAVSAEIKPGQRPGDFGERWNAMVHAITRALGMTGDWGNWVEQAAAKMLLARHADSVAQDFRAFDPVLRAVRAQMDEGRQLIGEAADRLKPLLDLKGQELKNVQGALIQFRLEDRKKADFGNPVRYEDEKGRIHAYTLTAKEQDVLEQVFAANKKVLQDRVDTLLSVLGLPSTLTHKDLVKGLANGSIKPSAKIVEGPLRVLEQGSDSYVPLRRKGPRHLIVYDQTQYRAAKNKKDRDAAILSTSNATTLDQMRKLLTQAISKYPTAYHLVLDRDPGASPTTEQEISEQDLITLAEDAGVSPGIMQMFMDAGISDHFATRGTGARFVGASKMAGFDTDMKAVNMDHAIRMTNSLIALKYGKRLENAISLGSLGGDKSLQRYAKNFVNSQTAPTPPSLGILKQIIIARYLGGNPISALVNTANSFIQTPMHAALITSGNMLEGAKFFAEAIKQHSRGVLAAMGRGHLAGKTQIQLASDGWKTANPGLSQAITRQGHAGLFEGKYDASNEDIARYGEVRGVTKVGQTIMSGLMHMFSTAERGNRLSTFVPAYRMYETAMSGPAKRKARFLGMAGEMNLDVSSAEAFAKDYTNRMNFRNDKTESSAFVRGSTDKNGVFQNSMVRQALYSLKNYSVNKMVQGLITAKAAWRQGLITRLQYAAYVGILVAGFGAMNVVPGLNTLAAVKDHFSDSPKSTEDRLHDSGALGAAASTGLLGYTAGKVSPLAGKYADILSQRVNNGSAIPDSLNADMVFAPIGMVMDAVEAVADVASGIPERQARGYASVLKSTKNAVEYGIAAAQGSAKTSSTGATVVAGVGRGNTVQTSDGDVKMPELTYLDLFAGAVGLTPPVVTDAYKATAEKLKKLKANDKTFARLVDLGAKAHRITERAAQDAAFDKIGAELEAWNKEADANNEAWNIIPLGTLRQAINAEVTSQGSGAFNLKRVQVRDRQAAIENLERVAPENRPTE